MYIIKLRSKALDQLKKLSPDLQNRILSKLEYYSQADNPLVFAERLTNFSLGNYRFRIGDYRATCDVIEGTIFILSIGHRREIYK